MPCRVCFWPATTEKLPNPAIDSYSPVDEGVTKLRVAGSTVGFLRKILYCFSSSNMHLIGFLLRAITRKWKLPLKKRGFMSLQQPKPVYTSDSVTRVNDSTRVTFFGDSASTRVMLRKMLTRLASRFSQHDSTRLESQSMTRVRVIFTKSLSSW